MFLITPKENKSTFSVITYENGLKVIEYFQGGEFTMEDKPEYDEDADAWGVGSYEDMNTGAGVCQDIIDNPYNVDPFETMDEEEPEDIEWFIEGEINIEEVED